MTTIFVVHDSTEFVHVVGVGKALPLERFNHRTCCGRLARHDTPFLPRVQPRSRHARPVKEDLQHVSRDGRCGTCKGVARACRAALTVSASGAVHWSGCEGPQRCPMHQTASLAAWGASDAMLACVQAAGPLLGDGMQKRPKRRLVTLALRGQRSPRTAPYKEEGNSQEGCKWVQFGSGRVLGSTCNAGGPSAKPAG